MMAAERQAAIEAIEGKAEVDMFNVVELVELYKSAKNNKVKYGHLFLLLGLNCGFANEEIADLKPFEIKYGPSPYIHRFRGKTETPNSLGIYAKWPLWPETAKLLKELMQTPNPTQPAIVTPEGRRLVVGRTDYVRTTWDVLRGRVPESKRKEIGLQDFSLKYLRKTSSTMIQNDLKFGEKTADAFLSHAGRVIISRYTPQDWDNVGKAVAELRQHLQPMFDAKA